jgi:hypothetical protein
LGQEVELDNKTRRDNNRTDSMVEVITIKIIMETPNPLRLQISMEMEDKLSL